MVNKQELLELVAASGEATSSGLAEAFDLALNTAAMRLRRYWQQGDLRRWRTPLGFYVYTLSPKGEAKMVYLEERNYQWERADYQWPVLRKDRMRPILR